MDETYDVVVVGGGAAGLSGALTLARARRRVLVVDGGAPRNLPADGVHGFLTRDGLPPRELVALGRGEVRSYGGEVVDGEVVSVAGEAGAFRLTLADGREVGARRVLVATGLVDELPDVPGVRERWGRDVLHCPYCHGWEVRDQAIGVLATSAMATRQALLFRQLSADVTLFAHAAPPPAEDLAKLAARGVRVVEGEVAALEAGGEDRLAGVRMATGELVPVDVVTVQPRFVARSALAAGLGLVAEPHPHVPAMAEQVPADPGGATGVAGVWVAGNVADVTAQVVGAADAGVRAGAMINADLVEDDVRLALAGAPA